MKLREVFSALVLSLGLMIAAVTPAQAQGISGPQEWSGVCLGSQVTGGENVATIQGLQCLIANIFSIAMTVIGFIGFIMLIYGAYKYLISGGNTKHTDDARKAITYSIIGLVVSLSAIIIINLIAAFTGVPIITEFVLPTSETRF